MKAELDIKKNLWFFDCHFKEDPVMPGCLGLDAMWQLVGFFLGWIGNPGKGRALGVGTVKFTGEVLRNVKLVKYEIDMKKIMSPGGTTVGLANGILLADEKKIYSKLKEVNQEYLLKNIDKYKKDLFNFRFQKINSQVTNPSQIGQTKKIIARLKTVLKGKINA